MVRQVHAAHILVKTEDQARDLQKRLNNGESFDELAKKFSTCPSGKKAGDLGWFGKGMMVPEFEKAAFGAKEGEIVGPVKSQFGYHMIKILGQK
jgi:peptidyl-prolyl cis-trans isomerase C